MSERFTVVQSIFMESLKPADGLWNSCDVSEKRTALSLVRRGKVEIKDVKEAFQYGVRYFECRLIPDTPARI